ncbi:hypothetical protein L596_028830 [Steinernema carpocapsae]|uniref:Uncharacterized protein n=1 Tax=Steinernema carpocapsae TaxID=34508 RepID=A0A4U5LZM8_STECR|nr:hypothetical protein L596_028830 [Steinernema carpocapsae]
MTFNVSITLVIRILLFALSIIIISLIMIAPGLCVYLSGSASSNSSRNCIKLNWDISVSEWSNSNNLVFSHSGQKIWGQLVIILILPILSTLLKAIGVIHAIKGRHVISETHQKILLGVGVCCSVAFAGLEIYYTLGFGRTGAIQEHIVQNPALEQFISAEDVSFVCYGWMVASILLLFAAIGFLADLVYMIHLTRDDHLYTY